MQDGHHPPIAGRGGTPWPSRAQWTGHLKDRSRGQVLHYGSSALLEMSQPIRYARALVWPDIGGGCCSAVARGTGAMNVDAITDE
jgi:hypothetical protein